MRKFYRILLFGLLCVLAGVIHAEIATPAKSACFRAVVIPPYNMADYDQAIVQLYAELAKAPKMTLAQRIDWASAYFLGRPYMLGALGEGAAGRYDQDPLYRTDAFDCTTYVATVLALVQARNLQEFVQILKRINYQGGQVSFVNRNHFMSSDWNVVNQRQGYLRDITDQFSVPAKTAEAVIDKPSWYQHLKVQDIKLLAPLKPRPLQLLLSNLRAESKAVQAQTAKIPYLPLSELFSRQNGRMVPNMQVFDQIPSGAVVEIVRANWDLEASIGTHLNVSHMGFAIRTPQGLMYRAASSYQGKVVDVPLPLYLSYYLQDQKVNPEVVGINVQVVVG